jgi:predicted metalloendopeptidase
MPFKDPEKARQCARKYYREHANEMRQKRKEWYRKNKARVLEMLYDWRENNPGKTKAQRKRHYEKHYEEISKRRKEWRKNSHYDYERYKKKCSERERYKKSMIIQKCGGKCARCGIDDNRILQIHHLEGTNKERKKKDWRNPNLDLSKIKILCANCHTIMHYESD